MDTVYFIKIEVVEAVVLLSMCVRKRMLWLRFKLKQIYANLYVWTAIIRIMIIESNLNVFDVLFTIGLQRMILKK